MKEENGFEMSARGPFPGSTEAPIRVAYLSRAAAEGLDEANVLAVVRFGEAATVARSPEIGVPLSVCGDDEVVEVWSSNRPVERGSIGAFSYARDGTALFGAIRIDEREADGGLETATLAAYRALERGLAETGYPSLCRVWNFFPHIHAEEAGLERYRAFCRGRHTALSEVPGTAESSLPAATAIGSSNPGLLVYGLAFRETGVQLENPRQLSAFHYPPEYGPRSPSFSRSVLKTWGLGRGGGAPPYLFVSGTASIVGHASRHEGDYERQLEETIANLEALLAGAAARAGRRFRFTLLRVYSRSAPPLQLLRERLAARFGVPTPVLVLRGDICRRELLLEIEGLAIGDD